MHIYVATPYTAKNGHTVEDNIREAREIAVEICRTGNFPVSPVLNTANFEAELPNISYDWWLNNTIGLMRRCDVAVFGPRWQASKGCCAEHEVAMQENIPIYYYPDIPQCLHLTEQRSPLQSRRFLSVVMQMYRTHLAKNADYSPVNILGTGELGLVTRLWDKVARLLNLYGFDLKAAKGEYSGKRSRELPDTHC